MKLINIDEGDKIAAIARIADQDTEEETEDSTDENGDTANAGEEPATELPVE